VDEGWCGYYGGCYGDDEADVEDNAGGNRNDEDPVMDMSVIMMTITLIMAMTMVLMMMTMVMPMLWCC